MPKSIYIDPSKVETKGSIQFKPIQVNQYSKSLAEERSSFTDHELLTIYEDIAIIREFESMLHSIKVQGQYQDFQYSYPGPAHLSMGQEAAAVGQAFVLEKDDIIFGSHRSHSEVLARGLSAIHKYSEAELLKIMTEFSNGAIYDLVKKHHPSKDIKLLAIDFLLYGALAEIFAKKNGFHQGLGGSMHVFFLPFGIYPNNAIVGGSAPIATGAALFKKVNDQKGIVIANIGDGSMGCGVVYESMNFAAMGQFSELWDKKGGLPILFNINDNGYGMGGQTSGETMAFDYLARIGAGISPSQLHVEVVNGFDPLAVIDATKRKKELLLKGEGPAMLDVLTYRFGGHSPSDSMSYREKSEIEAWENIDPLKTYKQKLIDAKIASNQHFENVLMTVKKRMLEICKLAASNDESPYLDFNQDPHYIENLMFSNGRVENFLPNHQPEVNHPIEENPRVKQIASKSRYALDERGAQLPKLKQFNIRDALFEAIIHRFYHDASMIAYGEDLRDWGSAFGVFKGLTEALPYHRLFNSPISEACIVSSGVGYGLSGGRVLIELMYADFMGRAGDEIFNQMAKWQAMSSGILKMPVVLRVSIGAKYGAQHSQDWVALPAHVPGLKVVFPVTPYDCKGLMNAALSGTDPVVFFESQRIYDKGEEFHEGGVPNEYYEIQIGEPDIKRKGSDITILTIGATLYKAMDAAKILSEKYGIEAEVIDARSVVPFNYDKVITSVKKTGRIILSSDACTRGSILNDMARNITELCFNYLDAPAVVVGAQNWITPPFEFDEEFFPQTDWILDNIHEKIMVLKGHICKTSVSDNETLRKAKKGV
jgi:2-oxoisovalerate dehydrogenase E1 component